MGAVLGGFHHTPVSSNCRRLDYRYLPVLFTDPPYTGRPGHLDAWPLGGPARNSTYFRGNGVKPAGPYTIRALGS